MEDMALLKKINFLKDLNSIELKQINMIAERSVFHAGEDIVKEGTACDAFYIIKSGSVKVLKEGRHIVNLGKEEPIGEVSFIDRGSRSATVTAIDDTVLIKIPSDSFVKLMAREKELANKIYKAIALILCRRLRETNDVMKLINA